MIDFEVHMEDGSIHKIRAKHWRSSDDWLVFENGEQGMPCKQSEEVVRISKMRVTWLAPVPPS